MSGCRQTADSCPVLRLVAPSAGLKAALPPCKHTGVRMPRMRIPAPGTGCNSRLPARCPFSCFRSLRFQCDSAIGQA